MNRALLILTPSLLLASLSACNPGANRKPQESQLVLTGSSTCAPLVNEIGKRFEKQNPGVRIDVQTGGTSRGISDARSGLADIGMASRNLYDSESALHAFPFARDGICIIVHKTNPIAELSDEDVIAIYTGKKTNWNEVGGGRDAPITVVHKSEGRSTLELFLKYFKLDNTNVKPSVVIGDNQQGIKTVAGNPDAIGYVSIGSASYEAEHGVAIKLLPMKGIVPGLGTVRDGSFPLSRTLNLVTREEPSGLALTFIEFARSAGVHDIIKEQYFVPLAP